MSTPARDASHVDALIARYANGRSVAQIERDAGLPEGALSRTLRTHARGKFPRFETQKRWAEALGAPLEEVSQAFAADADDSHLPLGLTAYENDLLAACRRLDDNQRAMLLDVAKITAKRNDLEKNST